MQLSPSEYQLFFQLQSHLNNFLYAELCREGRRTPEGRFGDLPLAEQLKVRQAFIDRPELHAQFVGQNPAQLVADELAIVAAWQHRLYGRFIILRHLQGYTVFLSSTEPTIAYGVLGLKQSIEEVIGPEAPVMVEALLLPFRDRIVYDGIFNRLGLSFGPGLRKSINESYRIAKEQFGIITALPFDVSQPAQVAAESVTPKSRPKAAKKPEKAAPAVKDKAQQALAEVSALIGEFCRTHLNEECAELCQKLAEKLARKRPSPLASGKPAAWAAGIVRAIAYVNFLDDNSKTPHIKPAAIDAGFGVSESTGQSKSLLIRKTLRIRPLEPAWTLTSRLDDNPLVWMLEVNGFIVDIRTLPRGAQQAAFDQGLIPYIPADRANLAGADLDANPSDKNPARKLFQFLIALVGSKPQIWREIEVPDGTLDDLHEHIQTAMGWTNSHLHQFDINGQRYGDPELVGEDLFDDGFKDSTQTRLSDIMPLDGSRLVFAYDYDFGDGWEHAVAFQGNPPPEKGVKYPRCTAGARACPPEDVGGIPGFENFVQVMTNPKHPEHRELREWYGGRFNPDEFNPAAATKAMQIGLPDWRSMKNG